LRSILSWKAAYDDNDSIIYLLDSGLRIARCNLAWDQFALRNHGEAAISSRVVGTHVLDVVSPDLRPFYLAAYQNVQRFRRDWWHIFECSSANVARTFQMRILPCDEKSLLTINTLISETALEESPPKSIEDYANRDGIVTICSHCRRAQHVRQRDVWDWVPELLMSGQALASFGLCDFCTAYHYHLR
jgi:hypothetical protein